MRNNERNNKRQLMYETIKRKSKFSMKTSNVGADESLKCLLAEKIIYSSYNF